MAKPKIHWYYGCCWRRAYDQQCASASFAKQAAENPDWYCVTCNKAARRRWGLTRAEHIADYEPTHFLPLPPEVL